MTASGTKLALDPSRSRLRIQTFAQGLFARLAHDLELVCRDLRGSAEQTGADDGTATLAIPIAKIDVAGVLKSGHVDPNGLAPSDRGACLGKMRTDVFHVRGEGEGEVVRVEATLERGKARVRVIPPNGRALARPIDTRIERDDDGVRVSGRAEISLDGIGSDPVKGPMNAFRMKDEVLVLFDLVFVEAP